MAHSIIRNPSLYCKSHRIGPSLRRLSDVCEPYKSTLKAEIRHFPSGLRVVANKSHGHFAAVGLTINTGTRYEDDLTYGSCHMLDRAAFKKAAGIPTDELAHLMESVAGSVSAHSSRETILYLMSFFRHNIDHVIRILAEASRWPGYTASEIDEVRKTISHELEDVEIRHDLMMSELVHEIAFTPPSSKPRGLSRRSFMTKDRIKGLDLDTLERFFRTWYTPDRMIISGVGVDIDKLSELAEKYFSNLEPNTPENTQVQNSLFIPGDYYGGIDIDHFSTLTKSPRPEDIPLSYINIFFEGLSYSDPDSYALGVVSMILGGGGSFSAGGPGKGMITRLYTNVLNVYPWIENCTAMCYNYKDTGLFGISAAVIPGKKAHDNVVDVICHELNNLSTTVTQEELERAKKLLLSTLLTNYEYKVSEVEDLGRQVTHHNNGIISPEEMRRRIALVNLEDISRAVDRVVHGKEASSAYVFPEMKDIPQKKRGTEKVTAAIRGVFSRSDTLKKTTEKLEYHGFRV